MRRQAVWHADRGGVRTVCRAECVVDVNLCELREPGREAVVVGFLAGMEAHVLEHQDLARPEPRDRLLDTPPHAIVHLMDRRGQHLAEPLRHAPHAQPRVRCACRAAQMAHQDQPRPALLQHRPDRRQRRADACIVGDPPCRERDVEVHPHQHRPLPQLQFAHGTHAPCGGVAHAERSCCGSPSGSRRTTIFTRVMRRPSIPWITKSALP